MSYPTHFVLIYLPNAISVPTDILHTQRLIMGIYKKIGLSHETGLIDTAPLKPKPRKIVRFDRYQCLEILDFEITA